MKTTTYYAQNAAINALVERYGGDLEQLTKDDKCIILAKLIEWVGCRDSALCIWMRTGIENLSPELRPLLLDLHDSPTDHLVGLMVAIATQVQCKRYAPNP